MQVIIYIYVYKCLFERCSGVLPLSLHTSVSFPNSYRGLDCPHDHGSDNKGSSCVLQNNRPQQRHLRKASNRLNITILIKIRYFGLRFFSTLGVGPPSQPLEERITIHLPEGGQQSATTKTVQTSKPFSRSSLASPRNSLL
jgi:hypothetical protein